MDPAELRAHIDSSFGPLPQQRRGLAFDLVARCWPRGSQDRSKPSPRIDTWAPCGPELLTACSCSSGRCAVCN